MTKINLIDINARIGNQDQKIIIRSIIELDALHDEFGDLRERINSTNANVSVVLQAVNELRYDIKNIIQSCPAV